MAKFLSKNYLQAGLNLLDCILEIQDRSRVDIGHSVNLGM